MLQPERPVRGKPNLTAEIMQVTRMKTGLAKAQDDMGQCAP
jgi:hypothetical protein